MRQFLHLGGNFGGDFQRIGVRGLIDRDSSSRLAAEFEILGIGLRAEIDAGDILEPYQTAALGGLVLDDDVGEFFGIVEP